MSANPICVSRRTSLGGCFVAESFMDELAVSQKKSRVVRMGDTSRIDTYVVGSDGPPGGVGEPATALVAPAVCNAIHEATGRRIRSLPLSRHKLA